MAYVTGTAANLAALLTGIQSACTANGWTLAGSVLHKSGVYQRLVVNGDFIDSTGGTGIDGGNNLTNAAPSQARIGTLTTGLAALVFPLTYHVFIGTVPDEVGVVIEYSTDKYQWLYWGKSAVSLPGSGGWFSGSIAGAATTGGAMSLTIAQLSAGGFGMRGQASGSLCPALFHASSFGGNLGEYINHGIVSGTDWSTTDIMAAKYRAPLDFCLPSAWNTESVLLPIQVFSTAYGSSKVAIVLDVAHARAMRIDNHQPGDVITLGGDRWMVFPWYNKSATETSTTSGRLGWAIRYDGP